MRKRTAWATAGRPVLMSQADGNAGGYAAKGAKAAVRKRRKER